MLGKIEGRRRKGQQRMRWLDGITDSMDRATAGDGEGQGSLAHCRTWIRKESDTNEQLNNNNRVSGLKYWLLVGSEHSPGPGMLVSS